MLKSTYKPSPAVQQQLPPGWTEHKAPTGHTYYYNAETKESTYKRPGTTPAAPLPAIPQPPPIKLSDPNVANAFMAQHAAPPAQQHHSGKGGFGGGPGGRGGFQPRAKPQPIDKPRSKVPIPGCEPWILVYTKYNRRFAHNPVKNQSYWRIPEKLMPAILELDKARIRQKAGIAPEPQGGDQKEGPAPMPGTGSARKEEAAAHDYDSSEYEEVEVTDDEDNDEDNDAGGNPAKRLRTEESTAASGPTEFTEADIAAQLAAMSAEYGSDMDYDDQAEYRDGYGDEYGDNNAAEISDADARALFTDLLSDFNISPFTSWDKIIEDGKIIPDPRYTALPTTRARREVWEEWSRAKIAALKAARATEEKKDPRIPYLAFLAEHASPKLYWAEFKRKWRKEGVMKDSGLADKEKERFYREHVGRLKLPHSQLKADLKKLLEGIPLSNLNNQTMVSHLPAQILSDVRYHSLPPSVRDPFIEAYMMDLPPPPVAGEGSVEEISAEEKKAQEDRQKREKALRERERVVAEEKRRQEKRLQFERARLRDGERELEAAMRVDKRGLIGQLGGSTVGAGAGSAGHEEREEGEDAMRE